MVKNMSFSSEIKEKLGEAGYECNQCAYAEAAGKLAVMIESDGESAAFRERMSYGDIEGADCCERAFLRGAFIKGGSVSDPEKSWHLEFDTKHKIEADFISELLKKREIRCGISERKGRYIVYVKDCDSIAAALGTIGAGADALQLFSLQAERSMRNDINRRVNFESANLQKSVKAASKHIRAIKALKEAGKWEKLPDSLKEIGSLRIENRDASLKELGEMMNPPIGKSGVNHRLNRLLEAAEGLF
ncbi:MAG: DNA-binding protein WhiA [bacterium]|nr:DNA-binding protein WhiA [bacterium]